MRIGIDLGGTKIEIAVLNEQSEFIFRMRAATPQNDYQATLATIAQLVDEADKKITAGQPSSPKIPVGIATPGSRSPLNGLMRNCNSTCLNGQPLQQDLEERLQRCVIMANDADCFALSEAIDGAASHGQVVFGVILGTGVGGGIVVDKKLLPGINAIAGEWGHNRVTNPDSKPRRCYCGRNDCVETYLSGPGLSESYRRVTQQAQPPNPIIDLMNDGDNKAKNVFENYCRQLARELATVINILDPDVVVLGGGLSNIEALYERVPKLWQEFIFSDVINTQLVPAKYGDSSGVRGAAWLQNS